MSLIPDFGGLPLTILAFIVALSIIVAVHEYGHYIIGRWSGIKAEVFSVGFGPVLFSRVDRFGTKWQLAALPFGGYVKFKGDSGAASGKDEDAMAQMAPEEARSTMHGAPVWARAATVLAGPVFNFILAIAIFAGTLLVNGQTDEAVIGPVYDLPADIAVLQEGDLVTAVDGNAIDSLSDLIGQSGDIGGASHVYTVIRDGAEIDVEASVPFLPLIGQVSPQSAGLEAGLRPGDLIRSVDGVAIHAFSDLPDIVAAGQGAPMTLEVWRAGDTLEFTLEPRMSDLPSSSGGFESRWLIGIGPDLYFDPVTVPAGLGDSLLFGVDRVWYIITQSISGLSAMITGQISACNLQGPIGIAETAGAVASQGLDDFIWFVAVLSVAVGFLNLFPIPVLDGGHLVFHVYEAASGRPPSDRAVRVLMSVGLTLLLSLMLFATFTDVTC